MRWYFAAAAAALLVIPAQASAASWYRVGGNDKLYSYIDLESITPANGKVRAVTLSTYAHAINGTVSAGQILTEYNCPDNSFRTIEFTYYDTNRKILATEPSETIDKWATPGRDSIDAALMKFACTRTGGTKFPDPFSDGYFGHV